MNTPKTIFETHASLTQDEIANYFSDNITQSERLRIEQKIAQDDFNSDGFDGLNQFPDALNEFDDLSNLVHQNLKKSQKFWKFKYTMFLAAFLALGLTLVAPYLFSDNKQFFMDQNKSLPIKKSQTSMLVAPLSDYEIETSEYLELSEMILPEFVIAASPVVMLESYKIEPKVVAKEFDKAMEIKKIDNPIIPILQIPTVNNIVYSNTPTFYVHKFLMVDYSVIYTDQLPTEIQVPLNNTTANLETNDNISQLHDEFQTQTKFVSYKNYLFETQEYFLKNNFKNALKRYTVILKHYPNDLNAHFYGGLCYFNLKQPNKAIQHFEVARKHEFNTFKIDAEWYIAKSYYALGQTESCIMWLESIIIQNEYYANQASELLNKIISK